MKELSFLLSVAFAITIVPFSAFASVADHDSGVVCTDQSHDHSINQTITEQEMRNAKSPAELQEILDRVGKSKRLIGHICDFETFTDTFWDECDFTASGLHYYKMDYKMCPDFRCGYVPADYRYHSFSCGFHTGDY